MNPGSFFALISDVTDQEMQWVGANDNPDIPTRALHTEAVRRVQVWTLEWLAKSEAVAGPISEMFEELARGVRTVPDLDLWMGEPGASGVSP